MKISSTLDFAADPAKVYAMLTDKAFLEAVCVASSALTHSTQVGPDRTEMSRTLEAPASAAKFTGDKVTVVEVVEWGPAGADGSRTGDLTVTIPGLPVKMVGTQQLRPGGKGTTVDINADLTVNIPFVGRKVEESAAPALLAGMELQQSVGEAHLSRPA